MRNRSRRRNRAARAVNSATDIPDAAAAAIIAPMLVPAYSDGRIPASSNARSAPMCARPFSAPPPRTSPMRGARGAVTAGRDRGVRVTRASRGGSSGFFMSTGKMAREHARRSNRRARAGPTKSRRESGQDRLHEINQQRCLLGHLSISSARTLPFLNVRCGSFAGRAPTPPFPV